MEVIEEEVVRKTAEGKSLPGVQYLQTEEKTLFSITSRILSVGTVTSS